jgi:tetratricopeptide (TPR) repeat protein
VIADLEKAIKLAKQDGNGQVLQLAQEDLNKLNQSVIKSSTNPQNAQKALPYVQSYFSKREGGDYRGAKEDLDKAIAIDPLDANLYIFRGLLKANNLNDSPGALADYNQGIKINSNDAYYSEVLNHLKPLW